MVASPVQPKQVRLSDRILVHYRVQMTDNCTYDHTSFDMFLQVSNPLRSISIMFQILPVFMKSSLEKCPQNKANVFNLKESVLLTV
jgi:hypothetical protein